MQLTDIAWNNLRRRKSKMLFMLLGMIIGVGTIVALFTITAAMNEEVGNKFDLIGSNIVIVPDVQSSTLSYGGVTIGGTDQEMTEISQDALEKIRSIKNEENIGVIAPKLLGVLETDAGKIPGIGVDFNSELRMKKWWRIQGKEPIKENEVLLGYNAAMQLDKDMGSIITIGNQNLVVAGILEEIGSEEDNALYLDLTLLQSILGKHDKLSLIEVSALCYTCPIEDIVMQISEKVPGTKVSAVLEAVEARKAIVDRFSTLARVVSLIILLIGTLVVMSTVMSSVKERTREIGIFRAIGFRKTHVVSIILLETTIVSVIAGIIGFLLGTVLAKILAPIVARMEVPVLWDGKMGLIAVALAVGIGIISSIIPALSAAKENPADALRYI